MNRFLILTLLCLGTLFARAQELEYQMEIGAGVGGSFYLGDANSTFFKNTGLAFNAQARYKFNPHTALRFALGSSHISGNSERYFLPGTDAPVSFSRTIYDLTVQFEYNFWGFGTGGSYKDTHPLTPYIGLGLGAAFAPAPAKADGALVLPLTLGVKYKLRPRLNVGLAWSMRFTTCDSFDNSHKDAVSLADPLGIKSSAFKNRDNYSVIELSVTYDFLPKYRKCNN